MDFRGKSACEVIVKMGRTEKRLEKMKFRRTSETPRSFSLCGHRSLQDKTFSLARSRKIRGTAWLGHGSSVVHQVGDFFPWLYSTVCIAWIWKDLIPCNPAGGGPFSWMLELVGTCRIINSKRWPFLPLAEWHASGSWANQCAQSIGSSLEWIPRMIGEIERNKTKERESHWNKTCKHFRTSSERSMLGKAFLESTLRNPQA